MNTVNISSNLTIVVNTCDAYEDVLDIFFHALHDYWPDCPCPVVINTELNTHEYSARVHNYDSLGLVDDWGARLLATLESIDAEYVLMLYDDFILDAPVKNSSVALALKELQSNARAAVCYLKDTALPLSTRNMIDTFIPLRERTDYCLNSAPGIWRKSALINYTSSGDTPWAWEVFGSYRSWGDGRTFLSLNPQHPDIYSYNSAKGGAIYRGKWVKEVVEQVAAKYSLNIDWTQRGFSSDIVYEKRSMKWKVGFMRTGFKMVGLKALYYLLSYVRAKIHA